MVDALAVYTRLIGAQVRSQLQYRVSFALDLTGTFLLSFIDFLAVLVIFHNIPRLGGWSVHEVAFLYATSSISFALCDLAIGHLDLFPQRIRDGTFDVLLLRPRGTLYQVLASELTLRRVGRVVQGLIVLGYALSGLSIEWSAGRAAVLVLMIPTGCVIYGSVWVAGACLAFWTTEVIPMAFVCYFPALYILDKPDPLGLPSIVRFVSPLVAVIAALVAGAVWRLAVRHYRSTGS